MIALEAVLVALLFIALFGFLLTGFPVAFVLAGTAMIFAAIAMLFGLFDKSYLMLLPDRIFGIAQNELLLAVPLFILMGILLERSRVAEDLLDAMGRLFGPVRGGLGISVTLVGALLAASTGIVGATVVTMGLMSLPTMLKRGYDPALATGSIAAAGTLGQIIPPSIVLILLGDVLSSAWQQAQRDMGVTATDALSVGELFAGALLPGILLVALYIVYQLLTAILQPHRSPAIPPAEQEGKPSVRRLLLALLPPVSLIVAVMGSILGGIATPTEAAAVGALGAAMLGALRCGGAGTNRAIFLSLVALVFLFAMAFLAGPPQSAPEVLVTALSLLLFLYGAVRALFALQGAGLLLEVLKASVRTSVMIFAILIGAALFSLVFRGLGGDHVVEAALMSLPGGKTGALIAVMLLMFALGFFLDFIEILFVVVPIIGPVLLRMGADPVWLGIMIAVNLQTSFLTPPFGFALFYLRGVAPESVRTADIYRGALPFVLIQLIALLGLALFPALATWLPDMLYGN
ncbi:MAG: TRAP transporter large permease subunit [Rhodothalassiaceae bacterium]